MAPTWKAFAARCWDFRPTSVGVLSMTTIAVLVPWLTGWPAWGGVLFAIGFAALAAAAFAALELSNEAAEAEAGIEPAAAPEGDEP